MNDELEGISHGHIQLLSWNFHGGIEENHKNTSVMIPSVLAEISTKHPLSTNLECYFWTGLFGVYAMKSALVNSSVEVELICSISENESAAFVRS
jgi:hypothetical protein